MIAGILITIACLMILGGFGFALLVMFAAGMHSSGQGDASPATPAALVGVIGIILFVVSLNMAK